VNQRTQQARENLVDFLLVFDHRIHGAQQVLMFDRLAMTPGKAMVSTQRSTPTFESGSHKRFSTVSRSSASTSML
jgi:hypothetical protein